MDEQKSDGVPFWVLTFAGLIGLGILVFVCGSETDRPAYHGNKYYERFGAVVETFSAV